MGLRGYPWPHQYSLSLFIDPLEKEGITVVTGSEHEPNDFID